MPELSDHDPEDVRRAIRREALSVLAHGLLLPFGFHRRRPQPQRRREQRTVVFVHGLGANRSGFLPLQAYLRLHGHGRQIAVNYRSSGSLERLALRLKREIDAAVGGGRIDLVAHSMGGLVARFYLQQLGGARRVDRLITLGTPHQGTHAANFIPSALVRQLLPDGPFIRHLNSLPAPDGLRVTSIVAGRDLLVQPVDAARCPFGEVVRFDDAGHLELLFRPEVFAEIGSRLRARRAPGRGDGSEPSSPVAK
ncbi:MAG: alpha/beta fold hydrolase [Myxococcota bacterium]|nr:alpha/beta fold hydrolase [Myxococcota bacterium]